MKKLYRLYMPDGAEGAGAGAAAAAGSEGAGAGAAAAGASADYKWEFKDPEIREAFPKIFPGMKTPEDLAKTAVHQQRLLGKQGVQLPKDDAEFATWAQTHLKAPKDGKGYKFDDFKFPEGLNVDKQALGAFSEHFAKAGMTQKQVNTVLEAFYGSAVQEQQQSLSKRTDLAAKSKATLEKKWGADAPKKLAGAEMALSTLGGPELVKLVSETGLSNHAEFVEFLANASELMKEDPITGKLSNGGFAGGKEQAAQEIEILYGDKEFMRKYHNPNDPGHRQAQDRMSRLYKIKHGELGRQTA